MKHVSFYREPYPRPQFVRESFLDGKLVQCEEEFLMRLEDLTRTIRGMNRLCGYCYTQLTDVQQEVNGLLTMEREFKADTKRLAKIFSV